MVSAITDNNIHFSYLMLFIIYTGSLLTVRWKWVGIITTNKLGPIELSHLIYLHMIVFVYVQAAQKFDWKISGINDFHCCPSQHQHLPQLRRAQLSPLTRHLSLTELMNMVHVKKSAASGKLVGGRWWQAVNGEWQAEERQLSLSWIPHIYITHIYIAPWSSCKRIYTHINYVTFKKHYSPVVNEYPVWVWYSSRFLLCSNTLVAGSVV